MYVHVCMPECNVTTGLSQKLWKPLMHRARLEKVEEARVYGIQVMECLGESNSPSVVPETKEQRIGVLVSNKSET